jgi:hypothetical protein
MQRQTSPERWINRQGDALNYDPIPIDQQESILTVVITTAANLRNLVAASA